MPRILVDLYKTKDLYSGLGQYSYNFAAALSTASHPGMRFSFLLPRGVQVPCEAGQKNITAGLVERYLSSFGERFDLWHSLHQFPAHLPARGSKLLITVHDLNFLLEKTPTKAARYLSVLQRNIDRANAVIAISQYTRGILEHHVDLRGKKIHVIHNGVPLPTIQAHPRPAFVGDRPYFLAIGVFKEKKNLHTLLPLLEHFPEHHLVLAGNHDTPYGARVLKTVQDSGWQDRVLMPGTVSDSTRAALYAHTEGLLFPSEAEGFGLPVVEALHAGAAVFALRATSVPEIGGDAVYYFDRLDPTHMSEVITNGLRDRAAAPDIAIALGRERARLFDQHDRMRDHLDLYARLC
jgi:glycosyltransferase involved in cell wall biosynthesis